MIGRDLSKIEANVLNLIINHATFEEERQAGLAPYKRQILTEQKNLATVMAVDLKEYWSA